MLQHNVRQPSAQPSVVYERPGDLLTGLATPTGPDIPPGRGGQLMAACTMRAMVLLDLLRPGTPLLLWQHGMPWLQRAHDSVHALGCGTQMQSLAE